MRYLPVFMDLRGRRALVLGSGEVAARKAAPLAAAGAEVVQRDRFHPADLEGCALAIGADAAEPELLALAEAARRRGVPVNIVDRPALCSIIMPAVIERDPITIAVSSAGVAPVLARLLRARIEAAVPAAFGRLAGFAESFVEEIRRRLPEQALRRRALERILGGRAADLVFAGDLAGARAEVAAELAAAEAGRDAARGIVFLVGAGPGPAELVTLLAHRLLGEADVVVHDGRVGAAVLDLARRDAARLDLDTTDEAPLAVLLRLARAGGRVVRLGAGDPFGTGDKLAVDLAAAGVPVVVVPGVAATASPG